MSFVRNQFAKRLDAAIAAAGISHRELASRLSTHPNRISEWVTGKGVQKLPQTGRLAEILDVTLDWLVTGRQETDPVERRIVEDLAGMAPSLTELARRAQ